MGFRLVISPSNADRLSAARDVVRACAPGTRVLIVGASRGAADDLARRVAVDAPATFGIQRLESHAARRTIRAAGAGGRRRHIRAHGSARKRSRRGRRSTRRETPRFDISRPSPARPGFPRALARTLQELRLAGTAGRGAGAAPARGSGPRGAARAIRGVFRGRGLGRSRRAVPHRRARRDTAGQRRGCRRAARSSARACRRARVRVRAVISSAATVLATASPGDRDAVAHFEAMGGVAEAAPARTAPTISRCLRQFLFNTEEQPPTRELDGSLQFFSAPGEGRECVEIARRVLAKRAAASASTRWRSSCARRRATSVCSSTPFAARTCRHGSTAARGVRIRPAARSSRCSRARPSACRRRGLPSTCRSARSRPDAPPDAVRWAAPPDDALRATKRSGCLTKRRRGRRRPTTPGDADRRRSWWLGRCGRRGGGRSCSSRPR